MSKLQVNENGRVSLHLIDTFTSRCVLDLDCNPDEVPNIVWCEMMEGTHGVSELFLSDLQRHIDYCHENGFYGFQLTEVYKNEEECYYYWEDDEGRLVTSNELPEVYYCWYEDTALVEKC